MYWPNSTNTTANTTTLTESNVQTQQQQQYMTQSNGYSDTYETALKDFNTAFRITPTPYASPAHEVELSSEDGSEDKGSINWGSVLSLSSQSELHDPLNNNSFVSEPWISPPSTVTSGSTSAPPAGSTSPTGSDEGSDDGSSNGSDDSGTGGHSYSEVAATAASTAATSGGDIGWKLSADDVIRAFPTAEGRS